MPLAPSNRTLAQRYHPGTVYRSSHRCPSNGESIISLPEGTVVGVLGRHFGVWSLNTCRIAYVLEEGLSRRRYGFAFCTLPGHVERGEERFTVEWHRADDSVWYEVFASARPAHPLAKAGRPFVPLVQRRFANGSLRSMAAAVEVGSER